MEEGEHRWMERQRRSRLPSLSRIWLAGIKKGDGRSGNRRSNGAGFPTPLLPLLDLSEGDEATSGDSSKGGWRPALDLAANGSTTVNMARLGRRRLPQQGLQ